ncbi:PPE family protein [Candidatus Mycobacterium methanotrophicum]|uniref:PPE family protein n=1 Tax=Candidatus Mycobacterium methanotrophicum TaxID=2943498 RepID=A0ABY4QGS4_9MYCO|nr:PPE family protein [Candidatus Mycobacterium methanotrophicum]UQX09412.1 PPE family protein [Candidatus Mycobacterium methanotrophicum]
MHIDYGFLPPEINSGRLYSGPGPGSMLTAADAWDDLAAELHCTASTYRSVVSRLASGEWTGPSSARMAIAAEPFVMWLHGTAARAEQTAGQAKMAAAAHSTALAATVPPPIIAANRSLLSRLIASNFFGQNTPAIGETEAQYAEMWAQDAAAMNGYSSSSAAAATLTPFGNAPQIANPAGQVTQAAAAAQASGAVVGTSARSALSQLVSPLASALGSSGASSATSGAPSAPSMLGHVANYTALPAQLFSDGVGSWEGEANLISNMNNGIGMATFMAQNPAGLFEVINNPPFVGPAGLGSGGSSLTAGSGQALKIGAVSVPPGWAMPPSDITPVSVALPANTVGTVPAVVGGIPGAAFGETMLGTLAGRGLGAAAAHTISRRKSVVPRSPSAG